MNKKLLIIGILTILLMISAPAISNIQAEKISNNIKKNQIIQENSKLETEDKKLGRIWGFFIPKEIISEKSSEHPGYTFVVPLNLYIVDYPDTWCTFHLTPDFYFKYNNMIGLVFGSSKSYNIMGCIIMGEFDANCKPICLYVDN